MMERVLLECEELGHGLHASVSETPPPRAGTTASGRRAPTTMRTRVFGTATAPTGSPDQANAGHADIPTVTVHRHRLLALVIVAACALAWVPAALAAPDPPTGLTAASPT